MVTSAALIMVAVFSAFATLSLIDRKILGVGMATAVLIDATIVRGILGEQVAQAAEFATQPLLTGKHLLFPVAQRRGGLEVSAANAASFCRRTRASWSAASARSAGTVSWAPRGCGSAGLPRPVSSSITRSQTRAWLAPAPISTWAAMPWPSRSRPSRRCSVPISPCPRPGRKAHYHRPGDSCATSSPYCNDGSRVRRQTRAAFLINEYRPVA